MSAIFEETLTFPQDDGRLVELVVIGDEFYARYETPGGYTAVPDPNAGGWCYATISDGEFVSTGVPVDKPPPPGLRRHVKESASVRAEITRRRQVAVRLSDDIGPDVHARTFGANRGLLPGRQVSHGQVRGLTVLVEFSDVRTEVTADDVDGLLNETGYSRNGNQGSVRDYFLEMSNGRLDYRNTVVGPIRLPHPRSHYISTSVVPDAVTAAVSDLGVDLSDFDSRRDGVVDAVNIMYAGRTLYQDQLWPHNSVLNKSFSGVRTHYYMLTSMGRRAVDLSIGTFCHESGHLLCRFPDLYDYGRRDGDLEESAGIGHYCLMGAGNHLGHGRSPAAICGYLRDLAGWVDDVIVINSPGTYTATAGDNQTLLKYETDRPNEYFVVENRTAIGRDAQLPSSGLAVFHCDTLGSNEWEDASRDRHYQVALVQADGHLDLEHNRNQGDPTDLYGEMPGLALSDDTTPSTRMWDGSGSGLIVRDVSAPGESIMFGTGAPPVVPAGWVLADVLIPDNDREGVTSQTTLAVPGAAEQIVVDVDITHPYVGDLVVELVSPSGATAVIRDRVGRSRDDVHETYSSTDADSALGSLIGEPAAGTWTLRVKDLAGRDVGRLDRWRLDVAGSGASGPIDEQSRPEVEIPDNDPTGVADVITVGEHGALTDIRVDVEIRHTFVGDLQVDLHPPSGVAIPLHGRSGGSHDDLVVSYDARNAPGLADLAGTEVHGDWTLRVRDLARRDNGRLVSWTLHLTR